MIQNKSSQLLRPHYSARYSNSKYVSYNAKQLCNSWKEILHNQLALTVDNRLHYIALIAHDRRVCIMPRDSFVHVDCKKEDQFIITKVIEKRNDTDMNLRYRTYLYLWLWKAVLHLTLPRTAFLVIDKLSLRIFKEGSHLIKITKR